MEEKIIEIEKTIKTKKGVNSYYVKGTKKEILEFVEAMQKWAEISPTQ
jgi:hypothetical protein